MALADDMAALSADILAAWDVRTSAIAGIRMDTAEKLHDLGEARAAMAKEQDERLKAEVAARRSDVATMLSDLDEVHAAMAKEQDERLKADVAARRNDVAAMLSELDEARSAMGAEQDERLKADVAARRSDVATMLSDLDEAHAAMAAEQRARLSDDRAKLAADMAAMMNDIEQEHAAMAAELRAHLSDDRAKLAADVAAERDERLADVEVRRAGWDSIASALARRRGGASLAPQPAAKPAVAPEPKVIAPEPVPEPVVVSPEPEPVALAEPAEDVEDDLTRIRGIGPGMQAHLNAVGIFSFAKLAKADVDMLRLELGDVARLARIEEWIDQAEKLTESG